MIPALNQPAANQKTETNIKLPLSFIMFGLGSFVISQIILFLNSDSLTNGVFRMPDIWMAAHFLLLGWAVMVVMGAMYQLVPVAFLTAIWNETFGFVQFFLTAAGVLFLSLSLSFFPAYAMIGGGLAVLGVIMFLFQMLMTLTRQKQKNIMSWFVGSALISLLLTIIAGFGLTWSMKYGFSYHNHLLQTHLLFGLTGWFTLLIFGFSYKMVPMFSLSHGFEMKWAKKAFVTYCGGLVLLLVSVWLEMPAGLISAWGLMFAGFTFFVLDMKEILQKRIKKKLDRPFLFSLIAIGFGWLLHFAAFGLSLFQVEDSRIWSWGIYLYIMIWIIFSIMGYLYKIVPFLWWTHKYSGHVGKKDVPVLKDMIQEKWGSTLFISLTIGVLGLTSASLLHVPALVWGFQGIISVTSLCYVSSIIRVLTR
ncbi:hypothetical protein [Thalassobacillus pellis]|uniref:hypothetical protein n=1 Tax=Thalassobacillus pellis TaxID=748008 RepID=UPI0019620E7E|nr:hypothetical protein [Thalassobacillus pellis]MBM7554055.1 MFS family permease [Thalassobacillus pellis]